MQISFDIQNPQIGDKEFFSKVIKCQEYEGCSEIIETFSLTSLKYLVNL
jgi:hypothetical protein